MLVLLLFVKILITEDYVIINLVKSLFCCNEIKMLNNFMLLRNIFAILF